MMVFIKAGDKLLVDRAFEIYAFDWGMRKLPYAGVQRVRGV